MVSVVRTSVRACGKELVLSPSRFGELRRSGDLVGNPEALQQRFREDGYLYLPGVLHRDDVLEARRSVLEALHREGCLDPDAPLEAARARPGLEMAFRPDLAMGNATVESVLYSERVMGLFGDILGGRAMHYDYTWLRAVAPGKNTLPHYDIVYMGRGTKNICTAWIPLGDIPVNLGCLMILEGSHRLEELKATYGQMDVDVVCENLDGKRRVDHLGYPAFGGLTDDPVALAEQYGLRWLTNDFQAGDLLTFSMFTLHASTDNLTDQVRLSTDSRYQLASEPADERWMGENPPGHGPNSRREMIC